MRRLSRSIGRPPAGMDGRRSKHRAQLPKSRPFHSDRDGESSHETQIYRMDATGSGLTRLTSGPDRHAYPTWSPDGERIVYTKERDGVRNLWVMARDGTGARRLTHHRGFDGDPIWAPDGRRIVFATDRFGDSRELAALEVDRTAFMRGPGERSR